MSAGSMAPVLGIGIANAAGATVLAIAVYAVCRRVPSPRLAHTLWLVVLLKLVAPPLFAVPAVPVDWLPSWVAGADRSVAAAAVPAVDPELRLGPRALSEDLAWTPSVPPLRSETTGLAPSFADVAPSSGSDPVAVSDGPEASRSKFAWVAAALWLGPAIALLVLAAWRLVRFRRAVALARPDAALTRRVERLAAAMGVPTPTVRVLDAVVPPLLWGVRRPMLVVPVRLLARLDEAELETLLAHELAHVGRRDPWVRPFECAVGALFWWHPIAWWARRNLRVSEESACDRRVLEALPASGRAYARALVETVEFLADARPKGGVAARTADLLTGAGEARKLKERLTMILDPTPTRRLPLWQRGAILATVAIGLAVVPAIRSATAATPPDPVEPAAAPVAVPGPGSTVPAPIAIAPGAVVPAAPEPASEPDVDASSAHAADAADAAHAAHAADAPREKLLRIEREAYELQRLERELEAKRRTLVERERRLASDARVRQMKSELSRIREDGGDSKRARALERELAAALEARHHEARASEVARAKQAADAKALLAEELRVRAELARVEGERDGQLAEAERLYAEALAAKEASKDRAAEAYRIALRKREVAEEAARARQEKDRARVRRLREVDENHPRVVRRVRTDEGGSESPSAHLDAMRALERRLQELTEARKQDARTIESLRREVDALRERLTERPER